MVWSEQVVSGRNVSNEIITYNIVENADLLYIAVLKLDIQILFFNMLTHGHK